MRTLFRRPISFGKAKHVLRSHPWRRGKWLLNTSATLFTVQAPYFPVKMSRSITNHYPLTMSNVGEPSWSWIRRDHNHVQKEIKFRLLVQSCCLLIKPIDFSTFALPSASVDLKVPIMADPEDYRHWQSKRAAQLRPPWAEWSARWQSLDNDTSLTAAPRVSKLAKTLLLVLLNNA